MMDDDNRGWCRRSIVFFLLMQDKKKRTPNAGQFWWWCASARKWRCMMGALKCCLKRVSQFFIPAKFIYYAVLASLTAPKVLITRKWVILLLFSHAKRKHMIFLLFLQFHFSIHRHWLAKNEELHIIAFLFSCRVLLNMNSYSHKPKINELIDFWKKFHRSHSKPPFL